MINVTPPPSTPPTQITTKGGRRKIKQGGCGTEDTAGWRAKGSKINKPSRTRTKDNKPLSSSLQIWIPLSASLQIRVMVRRKEKREFNKDGRKLIKGRKEGSS
jgi:hypothetical protein